MGGGEGLKEGGVVEKAFPESHLVLMQGPLVWITGTYYRRTRADPSSLSPGEMGAIHGDGGLQGPQVGEQWGAAW